MWYGLTQNSAIKTGVGTLLAQVGLNQQGSITLTNQDPRYEVYELNEDLIQEYMDNLGVWETQGARAADSQGQNLFVDANTVELLFTDTPQGSEVSEDGQVVATVDVTSRDDGVTLRFYFAPSKIADETFERYLNIELLKAIYLTGSQNRKEAIVSFNREVGSFVASEQLLVKVRKAGGQ